MSAAIVAVNTMEPQAKVPYRGFSRFPRRMFPRLEKAIYNPARKNTSPIRI